MSLGGILSSCLYSVDRYVHCALVTLISQESLRRKEKRVTGRGFFFFFNWSLEPVTFGCSPKTMILVLAQSRCVAWETLFYLTPKQYLRLQCSRQSKLEGVQYVY